MKGHRPVRGPEHLPPHTRDIQLDNPAPEADRRPGRQLQRHHRHPRRHDNGTPDEMQPRQPLQCSRSPARGGPTVVVGAAGGREVLGRGGPGGGRHGQRDRLLGRLHRFVCHWMASAIIDCQIRHDEVRKTHHGRRRKARFLTLSSASRPTLACRLSPQHLLDIHLIPRGLHLLRPQYRESRTSEIAESRNCQFQQKQYGEENGLFSPDELAVNGILRVLSSMLSSS